jgi:hypothetical protein
MPYNKLSKQDYTEDHVRILNWEGMMFDAENNISDAESKDFLEMFKCFSPALANYPDEDARNALLNSISFLENPGCIKDLLVPEKQKTRKERNSSNTLDKATPKIILIVPIRLQNHVINLLIIKVPEGYPKLPDGGYLVVRLDLANSYSKYLASSFLRKSRKLGKNYTDRLIQTLPINGNLRSSSGKLLTSEEFDTLLKELSDGQFPLFIDSPGQLIGNCAFYEPLKAFEQLLSDLPQKLAQSTTEQVKLNYHVQSDDVIKHVFLTFMGIFPKIAPLLVDRYEIFAQNELFKTLLLQINPFLGYNSNW